MCGVRCAASRARSYLISRSRAVSRSGDADVVNPDKYVRIHAIREVRARPLLLRVKEPVELVHVVLAFKDERPAETVKLHARTVLKPVWEFDAH